MAIEIAVEVDLQDSEICTRVWLFTVSGNVTLRRRQISPSTSIGAISSVSKPSWVYRNGVLPNWADWFAAAGVRDADVSHGLRFNSADLALDATVQGAGVLLAHDALAHDDLRTGRLIAPSST